MDQNENTKSGPEQEQAQSPAPQVSASQAEEQDRMKAESPRVCKICGGPNHQGCGCEARQKQAAVQVETENIKSPEQPESEKPTPAESETDDALEDVLSEEAIVESHKSNLQMAKDIKTMADGFDGLCACMYDTNNYLKVIAGDMITIRKFLTKEDEVKNADPAENKN